jgi:hypothetical protein
MPEGPVLIEGCVDSVPSALAAEAGRVELCDKVIEGGTTPGTGAIAEAKARLRIPVFVMLRPRGGDFLYSHVAAAAGRDRRARGAPARVGPAAERDAAPQPAHPLPFADPADDLAVEVTEAARIRKLADVLAGAAP